MWELLNFRKEVVTLRSFIGIDSNLFQTIRTTILKGNDFIKNRSVKFQFLPWIVIDGVIHDFSRFDDFESLLLS